MDPFSSGTLRRQTPAVQVYTIGHGTRTLDELVATLVEAGARTLVDVRRFPGSRRNPQFNQGTLADGVAAAGLTYRHAPELGGRRSGEPGEERFGCIRTAAFRSYAARMTTVEWQAALAGELEQPAPCFLCAETLPWRCHRHLIAEVLHAHGDDVVHLIGPGEAVPHEPWPQAETRDGRLWLCGEAVA
jgi:uncharacterized protein (DUF488 family)